MSVENFVIMILCTGATLDDLMHERKKYHAVMIDVLTYDERVDYLRYRMQKFEGSRNDVGLMFVFGKNDSILVRTEEDMRRVAARLGRS
jgi:hypothetical protein